jgi:hypothetical protein
MLSKVFIVGRQALEHGSFLVRHLRAAVCTVVGSLSLAIIDEV